MLTVDLYAAEIGVTGADGPHVVPRHDDGVIGTTTDVPRGHERATSRWPLTTGPVRADDSLPGASRADQLNADGRVQAV